VLSLKLSLALAALIEVSCGFPPQPLQEIAWMVPQLGHGCFCPNPFQFIIYLSLYHLTLYTVDTHKENVVQLYTGAKIMKINAHFNIIVRWT
jgi:hypothetical protein